MAVVSCSSISSCSRFVFGRSTWRNTTTTTVVVDVVVIMLPLVIAVAVVVVGMILATIGRNDCHDSQGPIT